MVSMHGRTDGGNSKATGIVALSRPPPRHDAFAVPTVFSGIQSIISSTSVPNSMTDSIEGPSPDTREGKETGVKMVQQANVTLANQPCCSPTITPSWRSSSRMKNNYSGLKLNEH